MNERSKGTLLRDHHYIYKGVRYNNKKDCKEGIQKDSGIRRVNDSLFEKLLALGVVAQFR